MSDMPSPKQINAIRKESTLIKRSIVAIATKKWGRHVTRRAVDHLNEAMLRSNSYAAFFTYLDRRKTESVSWARAETMGAIYLSMLAEWLKKKKWSFLNPRP